MSDSPTSDRGPGGPAFLSADEEKHLFKKKVTTTGGQSFDGTDSATTSIDFPDGGLRGWLVVVGGVIVVFCSFGVVQSFGVYQDYYTRILLSQYTPSEISWIGSLQVFLVFAVGLPAGKWFSAGYFHHLLISGSLLYLFSTFMLSLAQPQRIYQYILAQGIGAGLGMGLIFLPSLTLSAHYFRRKRSFVMGIMVMGASLGGCIYPIMLNNIFAVKGFGWGVRAVGFLDFGLLLIANLIMKTRLPPNRNKEDNSAILREILTDIPFLLFTLGSFLVFWGAFVPFFYLQLWSSSHQLNPTITRYSLTIMNGSSILGRVIPNFIGDTVGPLNTMIVLSFFTGALVFALLGATTVGGITAFGICYGFFSGGLISITPPTAGSFITRENLSDLPLRMAILSFVLAFPLLTGNPIAGSLLSPPHYLWYRPLIFAGVVLLAGTCCCVLAWGPLAKRKQTKYI